MKTKKRLWSLLLLLFTTCLLFQKSGAAVAEESSIFHSEPPAALVLPQSTDVQVNWSDDDVYPYTTQSETSIRVNPDTGTICVAYNDSQHSEDGLGKTGHSRSTDGGATFVDGGGFPNGIVSIPQPPYTKTLIANADPSLAWRDADGYFYYAVVDVNVGLYLWVSKDDCETFSYYSTIATLGSDKEIMAIDNNPASPNYYGRIYVAWFDTAGIAISYSESIAEEGATWATPIQLRTGAKVHAPWPAVDPTTSDVYVAWTKWHDDTDGYYDIEIKRSQDGGETWSFVNNPVTLAYSPHDNAATAACGNKPALNGYIKYYAFTQIVVDKESNLHVVYARDPDGTGVGDDANVYYRRSTNQGLTWGSEVQLNDDATLTDQWSPTVSVGPTGTVVATWYDRRNDPSNNYLFDYYMAPSLDNGVTWEPNIRVSEVSSSLPPLNPNFDLTPGWPCYHGDYDQQVQEGAFAYITWSDDRNIPLVHPDPDVWFEKVLVTPDLYHPVYLPLVISNP